MYLTGLIFLPIIFSLIVLILPQNKIRQTSLVLALAHFVYNLAIFFRFDKASEALQLVESYDWIPVFGLKYFVGVDGISFWLVMMTTFFAPIVILGSWTAVANRVRLFHVSLFMLQTFMIGTFLSIDSILFYIFFEASLIPMYLMIGVWGGPRRIYAAMKFFIYTMTGSLIMLVAILSLIFMAAEQLGAPSASILDFYKLQIPFVAGELINPQTLMFFAFLLAFAIKVPMFPVHTWLPDAHVEAPTPGSVILAAIMLKMGTYGFIRFVIPIFPEATSYYGWLVMLLGAIGIVYGALVAMVQPDIKKLVAYSSVSHMGYVALGLFALNIYGTSGALFQMLAHGVSTGALFLLVGFLYERTHTREFNQYGGLASAMPLFAICYMIVTMGSIGIPGTNGFIGEFYVLMGGFLKNKALGALAVFGVILGAVYMLWMFKKIFFGEVGPIVKGAKDGEFNPVLKDITWRERVALAPLILLIFWMGLFPNHFLDWSRASLDHLVKTQADYQLPILMDNGGSEK